MVYVPLAALVIMTLIYRNELGLKAVAIYWSIWVLGLVVFGLLKLPGFAFVALQGGLAAVMYLHVKKNQMVL